MLDDDYLLHGLNALSRAHKMDYFADGHKGAAIISACFLCRENDMESGVDAQLASIIEHHWVRTELCAAFPEERADGSLLERIVTTLEGNIGHLRAAGHNVIFPSLALRAFRELPEAVTPLRVAGICKLIEAFSTAEDLTLKEHEVLPVFESLQAMAEFVAAEFPAAVERFDGRGQGWTGHFLTYSRALIDLWQLGYEDLVRKDHHAFNLYVKRLRMGPQETDKIQPEHSPSKLRPLELVYWERRENADPRLGHCFKYPYGFYGILKHVQDPSMRQACWDVAYRVF